MTFFDSKKEGLCVIRLKVFRREKTKRIESPTSKRGSRLEDVLSLEVRSQVTVPKRLMSQKGRRSVRY